MASQMDGGDLSLPPETVCGYIEDMLMELADLSRRIGEPSLVPSIEDAAALAHQAGIRRKIGAEGDAA